MAVSDRARVFFALLPDAGVRDELATIASRIQAECGGRATPAAKIHLTLFFVGEVERSRIAVLQACADAVSAPSFALSTDVLGYWRHNRIAWAGARVTPPALSRLASDLTARLGEAGHRGEDRPYVPHVTLVRNVPRQPLAATLSVRTWEAREFALVESAGGRYASIARWPLAASL